MTITLTKTITFDGKSATRRIEAVVEDGAPITEHLIDQLWAALKVRQAELSEATDET